MNKFREDCSQRKGRLDLENGELCAILVKGQKLDPATIGEQPILPDFHAGDLVISSVSSEAIDPSLADIQLGSEHFMNIGERKLGDRDGSLSFLLTGEVRGAASVSVWTCLDVNLQHVSCNERLFLRR